MCTQERQLEVQSRLLAHNPNPKPQTPNPKPQPPDLNPLQISFAGTVTAEAVVDTDAEV